LTQILFLADGDIVYVNCTQILGDQQAALVGQGCLKRGHAKNTSVVVFITNIIVHFHC